MLEKRTSLRRLTLLDGRIEVEKLNGWAVGRTVRNVSGTGARLSLQGRAVVPQTFQLGISGGVPKPTRLVWYRAGQAGVAFADTARDPVGWDGVCRRAAPTPVARAAHADAAILRARIDAILARGRTSAARYVGFYTTLRPYP